MSDLTMYRGDAKAWSFVVTSNGTAVNISGAAIRFTAKRHAEDLDASALIRKSVGSGITIVDAAAGSLKVQLAAADTDSLAAPAFLLWDLQVVDAAGPHTVDAGGLSVLGDITLTVP